MTEISDFLKYIMPFIIFSLGVFTAPLVEYLKEKRKATRIKKTLTLEIKDEIKYLSIRLKNMAKALQDAKKMKNGEPEPGDIGKYVPRAIYMYFLKQAMDFSFIEFNEKQRNAMKSLFVQIEATNEYIKVLKSIEVTSATVDEVIDSYKRYLYTGSFMLNTMRVIINKEDLNLNESDKDIIKEVFNELKIEMSIDEILIKRTLKC
ncbi:hypothetical protein [Pectobacterium polaris]|uniref:hypothetical protein n=1 Tax=Pectobacterium polaris TaxID=2042057 RepID=UPI002406C6CF|nr:hypothetical protein [Pectobacterium polaris]MDG0801443.1 hypothetical protein [Pectobacterium polaris]